MVTFLERLVATTAAPEADVPDYVVHNGQAIFALRRPHTVTFARRVARLVYDSFREPLPAGVRSQQRLSRQALYEAGGFCVDLRLEHEPRGSLVTLVGQVANRKQPGHAVAHVPVVLMAGKQIVGRAFSNSFGEFQMEYAPKGQLRLHIPVVSGRNWIEVRLNDLGGAQKP
ncbi:MAG: hypothetical protein ACE14L_15115 [Terriglobales bacterium]